MIIKEADRLSSVREYYFSTKLKEIHEMRSKGIDVLNLGIGNPDMMPSKETVAELQRSSSDPDNHGYQSYIGIPELRTGISKWMSDVFNVELCPENEILPLIGSKEGIMHISMAFLNERDEVLVPDPGYPAYASVTRLMNAKVITYPLQANENWAPDFDMIEKLDFSKIKIMWVNYPNMPTGANLDRSSVQRLVDLAREKKFLIVNDNPYSMILNEDPQSMLSIDGSKDVLLELNSMSKSHNMAGWRLGWVAGKASYLNAILKVKSNVDSGMFLPIQKAAVKALTHGAEWFKPLNEEYIKRRDLVWKLLETLECKFDKNQVGMFVWAEIPENISGVEFFTDFILARAHVFITPGSIFGNGGKRYVRVSLCNPQDKLQLSTERVKKLNKENQLIGQ